MGVLRQYRAVMPALVITLITVVVLIFLAVASLKVINQNQRGIVLRLGRFVKVSQPGLTIIIPFMDHLTRVGVFNQVIALQPQQGITADNVSVSIDAVVTFMVSDPRVAILEVSDFQRATLLTAETALRATIGAHKLDELLSNRTLVNTQLTGVIDTQVEKFGIKVASVEIRDVRLDDQMIRSMAAVAEAEREGRAKVVAAEADRNAASILREAADIMDDRSFMLLQLNTLREIAKEKTTIVVPADMPALGQMTAAAAAALSSPPQATT